MTRRWGPVARRVVWLLAVVGGLSVLFDPARAPVWVCASVATAFFPLARAWLAARGTALRSALVWGFAGAGLGVVAQATAASEALSSGRPGAEHWAYLAALAALASLVSVLNARRPGIGAWAILMGLMVLLFLIPWLEGSGLVWQGAAWSRLRLETPWTLFYILLVLAGVTNYLPTRFGPAASWVGLALALEYAGLTWVGWSAPQRAALWSAVPWCLAVAVWTAEACARRPAPGEPGLERLWLWFRNHWGVVWALRVQDRFNRTAELSGWPIRLGWYWVVPARGGSGSPAPPIPPAAEATLKGLLRRFAEPARLEAEVGQRLTAPCQPAPAP